MTFHQNFNAGAFNITADRLRVWGHEVFNPVDADLADGFDLMGMSGDLAEIIAKGFDLAVATRRNLLWICTHGEAIVLLPGWTSSAGTAVELSTALACGQPAFEMHDLELVQLDVAIRHDIELVGYHHLSQ